jgi:hypothetical protein
MLELGIGEGFPVAFVNAALIALTAVLPGLLFGYTRQSLAAWRSRPEFSLRKLEGIEFDRAVLLYEMVRTRLDEINDQRESSNGFWRALVRRADNRHRYADELDDLEAHAQHLHATISRLKRRPLQRLRSWVHITSSRYALGHALAAHVMSLALLIVAFRFFEQTADADEIAAGVRNLLDHYPLEGPLFCTNAVAAGLAAMAAPVFYLVRRARLRQELCFEFATLEEFAEADPDPAWVMDEPQSHHGSWDPSQQTEPAESAETPDASGGGIAHSCFAILGLSETATIEDIKQAYKALIKQNHPDRVHGMSPAFRKLAEAETKKLNAAYQEALITAPPLESAATN